jgi:hypothetical protein
LRAGRDMHALGAVYLVVGLNVELDLLAGQCTDFDEHDCECLST